MATTAAGSGGARAAGKPPELEGFLNRVLFHPMSRRLALALVPTPVTPNMVSVAGAILVFGAAFAYTGLDWPTSVAIGFTLHMLWHVVDGADGSLARLTGRASPVGELVDGACDYIGHGVLYVALAAFLDDVIGLWAWPLATLSALSRTAQANHSESQRRIYMWRAYGIPWLQQARSGDDAMFRRGSVLLGVGAWFARGYIALADALSPNSPALDRAAEEALHDPAARRRMTRLSRRASRTPLVLQMLLGANPRTLLLGISMAAGSPLWFFLAETTLLNLLLIVSIRQQKKVNETLAARLAC